MKKKASEETKELSCNICALPIDINKEFCEFTHYKKIGNIKSEAFYHVSCFRDRLNGSVELRKLQKKADWILNKAASQLGA